MKRKHCKWCDTQFETDINYQIYCSADCRTEATRIKIAERYDKTRRQKKSFKQRVCKNCGTRLSVYNDSPICQSCDINPEEVKRLLREIKGIANGKHSIDPSES